MAALLPASVQLLPGLHCLWPQVLLASPAFRAAFAGHDHTGGYALIDGRHFVTVEGLLETPSDGNAYATVDVHADRLVVHGRGSVTSRQLLV